MLSLFLILYGADDKYGDTDRYADLLSSDDEDDLYNDLFYGDLDTVYGRDHGEYDDGTEDLYDPGHNPFSILDQESYDADDGYSVSTLELSSSYGYQPDTAYTL